MGVGRSVAKGKQKQGRETSGQTQRLADEFEPQEILTAVPVGGEEA